MVSCGVGLQLKPCLVTLVLPWDFDTQQICLLYLEVTQQGLQLAGGVLGVLVS